MHHALYRLPQIIFSEMMSRLTSVLPYVKQLCTLFMQAGTTQHIPSIAAAPIRQEVVTADEPAGVSYEISNEYRTGRRTVLVKPEVLAPAGGWPQVRSMDPLCQRSPSDQVLCSLVHVLACGRGREWCRCSIFWPL